MFTRHFPSLVKAYKTCVSLASGQKQSEQHLTLAPSGITSARFNTILQYIVSIPFFVDLKAELLHHCIRVHSSRQSNTPEALKGSAKN